ncbi:MAG: hypothetical protein ACYCQI_02450 [Gammaproteobacteria bacterium]
MLKKILLILLSCGALSFASMSFADTEEVHWWYHPDLYQTDFEEWYPGHVDTWKTYYSTHKEHYESFCTKHRGWTFCENK